MAVRLDPAFMGFRRPSRGGFKEPDTASHWPAAFCISRLFYWSSSSVC